MLRPRQFNWAWLKQAIALMVCPNASPTRVSESAPAFRVVNHVLAAGLSLSYQP